MPPAFRRPEDRILDAIRLLERRVRRLEAAGRVTSDAVDISIPDRRITIRDISGDAIVIIGENDDGGRRFWVNPVDPADIDRALIRVDELGIETPIIHAPMVDDQFNIGTAGATHPSTVTGSMSTMFEAHVAQVTGDVYVVEFDVTVGASTTAEVRLLGSPAGLTSDALAINGPTTVSVRGEWLHGFDVGTDEKIIALQGRRSAGANSVQIYQPRQSYLTTSRRIPGAAHPAALAVV